MRPQGWKPASICVIYAAPEAKLFHARTGFFGWVPPGSRAHSGSRDLLRPDASRPHASDFDLFQNLAPIQNLSSRTISPIVPELHIIQHGRAFSPGQTHAGANRH